MVVLSSKNSIVVLLCTILHVIAASASALEGGALAGNRCRVIVSTDANNSGDPDDYQSLVHFFVYLDLFDCEGLISSFSRCGDGGRVYAVTEAIDAYGKDFRNLSKYSSRYPTPSYLRSITKQGKTSGQPSAGYSSPTAGSRHIIECAKKDDDRPLYILVWGSITDVAQAVHDDPSIKVKIRVYFIAWSNMNHDRNSYNYLKTNHKDLWWIFANSTFIGMHTGGDRSGDYSNRVCIEKYVKDHGALGEFYWRKKKNLREGDSPSFLYLLRGNPDDPTEDHWGGRFAKASSHGPTYWEDIPGLQYAVEKGGTWRYGAQTVHIWLHDIIDEFAHRMDRCNGTAPMPASSAADAAPPGKSDKPKISHQRKDRS